MSCTLRKIFKSNYLTDNIIQNFKNQFQYTSLFIYFQVIVVSTRRQICFAIPSGKDSHHTPFLPRFFLVSAAASLVYMTFVRRKGEYRVRLTPTWITYLKYKHIKIQYKHKHHNNKLILLQHNEFIWRNVKADILLSGFRDISRLWRLNVISPFYWRSRLSRRVHSSRRPRVTAYCVVKVAASPGHPDNSTPNI